MCNNDQPPTIAIPSNKNANNFTPPSTATISDYLDLNTVDPTSVSDNRNISLCRDYPSASSLHSACSQGHEGEFDSEDDDDIGSKGESATTTRQKRKSSSRVIHSHQNSDLSVSSKKAVEDEVEKRKRKLARNRASARLRRLKKKTLIETLEQDMQSIEQVCFNVDLLFIVH